MSGARFVFPLEVRQQWTVNGSAPPLTIEYEWSVAFASGDLRYEISLSVIKHSGEPRVIEQSPAFEATPTLYAAPRSGGALTSGTTNFRSRPAGRYEQRDHSRLVIVLEPSYVRELRTLFAARPMTATFSVVQPGRERVEREVSIDYSEGFTLAPPAPALKPTWTRAIVGATTVAISANQRCTAVAAAEAVQVFDRSGTLLWSWNYARDSRYIAPGELALGNSCRVIAMVGNPGYKYTWLVHQRGPHIPISTTSTPLSVSFDHQESALALGTGSGDVLLLDLSGAVRWRTSALGLLVRKVEFSADDRWLSGLGLGTGVVEVNSGAVVWSDRHWNVIASGDAQTFVANDEPPHGPGFSWITVLDEAGKPLWTKLGGGGAITPDGQRIAAVISNNQYPQSEFDDQGPGTLTILSREGEILVRFPNQGGGPVAMSSDAGRLLLETLTGLEVVSFDGRRLAEIPVIAFEGTRTYPTADMAVVAVLRNRVGTLEWYDLRQVATER